jgi:hypothetical protein
MIYWPPQAEVFMPKQISRVLFCLIALGVLSGQANNTLSRNCDGRHLERADRGELARFDSELRHALHHQDITALAVLVHYPLRVNTPNGGTILIANPQALQARWPELFPAPLREAVLKTAPADVACRSDGIMYGNGVLWVRGQIQGTGLSYRIHALNVPTPSRPLPPGERALAFVCETPFHRIVIDRDGEEYYRYRAWNKPRSVQLPPDAEVLQGSLSYDGSGICAAAQWRFSSGNTTYVVSELSACQPDVPEAALGQLEVTVNGKVQQPLWCQ